MQLIGCTVSVTQHRTPASYQKGTPVVLSYVIRQLFNAGTRHLQLIVTLLVCLTRHA